MLVFLENLGQQRIKALEWYLNHSEPCESRENHNKTDPQDRLRC